jgi:two-component sensor histidine kinase
MTETPDSPNPYFELALRPSIELVSVVRRFVQDLCRQLSCDRDTAVRAGLTAHELLENAIRHTESGQATLRLELLPATEGHTLLIKMSNEATEEATRGLEALFADMRDTDPAEHYEARMRQTAKRAEGSGLGLARIRVEAKMDLELSIEPGVVTIWARTPVTLGEPT